MRKHTKEYKKSISLFGREIDSKIQIIGSSLTLNKENLFSINLTTYSSLFKTVMKQVDFESKLEIGKNQEINVKSGVKVNGEYEYIDYGNYLVYENEYKAETDTYLHKCYDKMLKTMIDYVPLEITYPINLREYINAIAIKCGLEFANKNSEFVNYNTSIKEDHFNNGNYTFRDVLDYIAQLVGGWFCINDDGKLEIRYPSLAKKYDKVSGENVSFTSNVDDKIRTIIVDGKSEQATRSGKNLFNKNAPSIGASNATKTILDTGVRSTLSSSGVFKYYAILLGKEELLSETLTISCTITPSAANVGRISLYFGDSTKPSVQSIVAFSATVNKSITVAIPGEFPENCDRIWALFYANTTGTGNVGDYVDYTNLMIVEGDTVGDYEDYGVMPSPDYPSEIECLKGKNLFDKNNITRGKIISINDGSLVNNASYGASDYIFVKKDTVYHQQNTNAYYSCFYDINKKFIKQINAYSFVPSEDGYMRTSFLLTNLDLVQVEKGAAATDCLPYNTIQIKNIGKNLYKYGDISDTVSNGYYVNHKLLDNFESNTTYTLSLDITSSVQPFRISVGYGNDAFQKEMTDGTIPDVNNGHITFTFTTSDTTYSNLWIRAPRYTTMTAYTATVSEIMLEKGSTPSSYEPYQENTLNIDLQGNELCSLPNNIKDELVVENGRAKIIKRVGKVVLDGSENWKKRSSTSQHTFLLNMGQIIDRHTHAYCTHFTEISASELDNTTGIYSKQTLSLLISYLECSTVDEFKTWLSTHNTIVYYELETPTEIDLGEVETLSTSNGINNVLLDANMQTNMTITYPTEYEEFDKHFLKNINVTFAKKYGAINSVVFSRGGGSDNICRKDKASINKNGLTEIKITDNPFLESDDRENFIQPLFDKINGLEFYLMDVNSTGIMYMELGDLYYFNMVEEKPSLKSGLVKSGMRKAQGSGGGKYLCLLMNDEIKITQGIEESIFNDEPELTETDYKNASITDTSIKNAIIQTNKNSADILLKVNSDNVISAINLSPENIKISSAKLDIDAIATFTNSKLAEAGSTVINGANITTGSISCDRLNGGTINGQAIRGGSISIQTGNYYFNMGTSTSNPNCSGLNVGNYGIKANSNITATGFAITDSDTGKTQSINIYDGHGKVWYLTFTGGILTASEYK